MSGASTSNLNLYVNPENRFAIVVTNDEEEDPEEEINALKAAMGKLQETFDALERQFADAMATNAKLTAGLRNTPASSAPASPATFDDAIRELRRACPHMTYNEAFVQAAKQFPRLWKEKMSR